MRVLLLADHDNRALNPATHRAVGALSAVASTIHVLVAGHDTASVAGQAAKMAGVDKVLVADAPHLASQLPEEMAPLIVPLMEHYDGFAAPATASGKNIAPRVAALLDVGQVSDVQAIIADDTFERPTYAGNAVELVQSSDDKLVLTLRPSAFTPTGGGGSASMVTLRPPKPQNISAVTGQQLSTPGRADLSSAKIILAGGRGLGSAENFRRLERMAERLGAAVGATRAAVEAGFIGNEFQIGQTGKIVAPELYIAVGISGAIQHLAGIRDSRIIVAINKDPNAPIFQVADYGLVGDLFTILPQLESVLPPLISPLARR